MSSSAPTRECPQVPSIELDSRYRTMEGLIAGEHPLWNQSAYFNAYDPVSKVGCFIRFGFMQNQQSCNSWFILFEDGKPLFQRLNASLPYTDQRLTGGVNLGGLQGEAIEPFTKARISLSVEKLEFDLIWDAMQPLVDSIALTSADAEHFERELAHAHLEGSSRVTGTIQVGGRTIMFDGRGGRDLAFGPRDWGKLRHYRAAFPVFDDGFTAIAIHGLLDEGDDVYMKVLHDGTHWHRIRAVEEHLDFEEDEMTVSKALWKLRLEDGRSWTLEARRLFRAFIPIDNYMLAEHMMEYVRDDGAVGYGLVECGYRFPWAGNGSSS